VAAENRWLTGVMGWDPTALDDGQEGYQAWGSQPEAEGAPTPAAAKAPPGAAAAGWVVVVGQPPPAAAPCVVAKVFTGGSGGGDGDSDGDGDVSMEDEDAASRRRRWRTTRSRLCWSTLFAISLLSASVRALASLRCPAVMAAQWTAALKASMPDSWMRCLWARGRG
jgi:hypothetical protein